MISSILILTALATGGAAETFSGTAKIHENWSGTACGGKYDGTQNLLALNSFQYDVNGGAANSNFAPVCGNTITVNYGGKSIVVTIVDRGTMGVNNFDLSTPAFEQLADISLGKIEVTWSWNDGFDPATGTQNKAGLAAVGLGGEVGGGDTAAVATSPIAAVGTSVASTPASEATALAAGVDAAAVPIDPTIASVPPVDPSAGPVVPAVPAVSSAASSASSENPGRPTGYYGGSRQSKRCAAQL